MNFNERYNNIKQIVKPDLDIIEKKMTGAIHVREPLNSYLSDFLTFPSKRVRSLLALLYLKANNITVSDNILEIVTADYLNIDCKLVLKLTKEEIIKNESESNIKTDIIKILDEMINLC